MLKESVRKHIPIHVAIDALSKAEFNEVTLLLLCLDFSVCSITHVAASRRI